MRYILDIDLDSETLDEVLSAGVAEVFGDVDAYSFNLHRTS